MNSIEYFLTNPEFVRWVKESDRDLDEYWSKWLQANPNMLEDFKLAKEIVSSIHFEEIKPKSEIKEEILSNILNEVPATSLKAKEVNVASENKPKLFQKKLGLIPRIAAILVLSLSVPLYMYVAYNKRKEPVIETIPLVEKVVSFGEKLSFTLPDGTNVWLNSGSKLIFPERFSENERSVSLQGEGFFEVEKDSLRPFRVSSAGYSTTALGTSFNIKTGEGLSVALVTGSVLVTGEHLSEEVVLDPGLEFFVDQKTEKSGIRKFNKDRVLSWKEGRLYFENAGLLEVVKTLEAWYGVDIKLENSDNVRWKFSGEYQNQTLDNVLNSMSYIEKFKYKINGKTVELRF